MFLQRSDLGVLLQVREPRDLRAQTSLEIKCSVGEDLNQNSGCKESIALTEKVPDFVPEPVVGSESPFLLILSLPFHAQDYQESTVQCQSLQGSLICRGQAGRT